ncbi:uncharacterized protein K441DRAFT_653372 [Cenococcum geophilum 1.58]|uniref:uncharacterized protein n=1 Tax=Cenococcum geophilum 1.58 TaxID=794803 RepID=UPI00358FB601|nr:hypothetical protein K441DRAFT_653372 [Cenococcum geophilum 1.58]
MPSNYTRIDADPVQKTQYKVPPNKTAKIPPPKALATPRIRAYLVFLSTATKSY